MAASDMKDLLTHELGDLLYAEQLILKMLGTLTREVKNPEMLGRVREHVGETEEQIERLRRAFESIGEKAKAEKCQAAIGLKEEHDAFKKEEKPSRAVLEAFDLGNSLRVEHYEIAGYRSAIAVATAMGEREVIALLSESLREEEAMASFIERSSVKALKGLAVGMDLATGAAQVVLKTDGPSSSSRSRGAKSASGGKPASASGGKGNGRSTTSDGGTRSSSSRSTSSTGKSAARKSSGGTSSSRSAASKSNGSASGRSGGGAKSSSGKSGGSKSGGSRSTSARGRGGTGSSARA